MPRAYKPVLHYYSRYHKLHTKAKAMLQSVEFHSLERISPPGDLVATSLYMLWVATAQGSQVNSLGRLSSDLTMLWVATVQAPQVHRSSYSLR